MWNKDNLIDDTLVKKEDPCEGTHKVNRTENPVCQRKKFGCCKFSKHCKKDQVEEKYETPYACKDIKPLDNRHIKVWKIYSLENFSRFGEHCPYEHWVIDWNKGAIDEVMENVKNLKAEVYYLKRILRSLLVT